MSELISWIRGFLTTLYVSAIIKDGKCYLFPRAGEDVSAVVSHPGWRFSSRR